MNTWAERAKAATAQNSQIGTAKTDETHILRLSSVLTVPPLGLLEKHDFAIGMIEDPERWCWPNSSAMTEAEIDAFNVRLLLFTSKGLSLVCGQALAMRLSERDRDLDDRRVCLECTHLSQGWRCKNWFIASGGFNPRRTSLAEQLVLQLQRCNGFNEPVRREKGRLRLARTTPDWF